ncbi:hypothetical protein LPTSP4_03090 [Leptospira ryugenii]|uniref:Uncharacterized protein n=1 Tax=Leptospira ryugenii TaxID=1917863 RepID=A0A2P2DVZ6_9LEPT|nr:hypothetical protein LPTSP4_03090 [Leptospira ryugenii]
MGINEGRIPKVISKNEITKKVENVIKAKFSKFCSKKFAAYRNRLTDIKVIQEIAKYCKNLISVKSSTRQKYETKAKFRN